MPLSPNSRRFDTLGDLDGDAGGDQAVQQPDGTLDRDAEAGGKRGGGDQRRGGQHVDASGGMRVAPPAGHGRPRREPGVFEVHQQLPSVRGLGGERAQERRQPGG